jgi:chorismate mutase
MAVTNLATTWTAPTTSSELEAARKAMDSVDRRLVSLIAERADVAREIGRVKRSLGATMLDPAREAAVVRRAGELARESELDTEVVRTIFWQLIALSRSVQSDQP